MAALFFVRDLVLELERAGTGFDHLLREEVRRLGIAEARVDVGDDRHDVRLVIVDARLDLLGLELVALGARSVEFAEQTAERSDAHTSELQSLMRISYAVFFLTKQNTTPLHHPTQDTY